MPNLTLTGLVAAVVKIVLMSWATGKPCSFDDARKAFKLLEEYDKDV